MNWSLRRELPLLIVLAAMFALSVWAWERVPDEMPVHYNLQGEPDRWGGRFEGLLLLPLATIGIYALFLFLPVLDPGRANYPRFANTYLVIRAAVLLVMATIHAAMVAGALGREVPITTAMTLMAGSLFVVLGLAMGKLRPNWFVGVRTPWTLSSKLSWTRSHRLAGWLFLISGAATLLVLGLGSTPAALIVMMASGVAAVVTVVVYSWIVWRKDPERVPPAGTSPAEPG